jgi:hypothetical protein
MLDLAAILLVLVILVLFMPLLRLLTPWGSNVVAVHAS